MGLAERGILQEAHLPAVAHLLLRVTWSPRTSERHLHLLRDANLNCVCWERGASFDTFSRRGTHVPWAHVRQHSRGYLNSDALLFSLLLNSCHRAKVGPMDLFSSCCARVHNLDSQLPVDVSAAVPASPGWEHLPRWELKRPRESRVMSEPWLAALLRKCKVAGFEPQMSVHSDLHSPPVFCSVNRFWASIWI